MTQKLQKGSVCVLYRVIALGAANVHKQLPFAPSTRQSVSVFLQAKRRQKLYNIGHCLDGKWHRKTEKHSVSTQQASAK